MPERDPLVGEFAALRSEVSTHPPGVDAAQRLVRRRRHRRVTFTVSVVVVLAGLLGFGAARWHTPASQPMPEVLDAAAPADLPVEVSTPPDPQVSESCHRYGAVRLDSHTANRVTVRVDPAHPLCAGERVRVFVATYGVDGAGRQTLFRYQVGYLDADHDPLTLGFQVPGCHAAIYVGSGAQQIRESIPANSAPQGDLVWMKAENTCPAARSHT